MIYKIREKVSKNRKKKLEALDNNDNSTKKLPKNSTREITNQLVKLKEKIQTEQKRKKILNFLLIGILYFSTYTFFYYLITLFKVVFMGVYPW